MTDNAPVLQPDKTDYDRSISSVSAESHKNSMYENHEITLRRSETDNEKVMRASKSVLMQFDPLSHGKLHAK